MLTKKTMWSGSKWLQENLGISPVQLNARNIPHRAGTGGKEYDMGQALALCSERVLEFLNTKFGGAGDMEAGSELQLKRAKLTEEVRKLRISNDIDEGALVPKSHVVQQYGRGLRQVCDVLDSLPTRIRMKYPDLPPGVLSIIQDSITECRNEAARDVLAEDQEDG